jgi:ATP-dependent RNA helicase RhlE
MTVTFADLQLHPSLVKATEELGYVRPTSIQGDSIPPALAGRDLLACAATGSGKTAAFMLPILNRLMDRPRGKTRALVIAPTRELAAQILEDMKDLGKHTAVTGAAIFGGVGMGPQETALRRGVDVIVACPGRLLDHLQSGNYADFSALEVLVLDEADRMLDMGFLPDIRRVLKHVPKVRQTLFFSATMPGPIATLARELLNNPATIALERESRPASTITQALYPVPQELKSELLATLLERGAMNEVLVFTRTKHRANRLAEFLTKRGISADRIHGNRSQTQRTAALANFKDGKTRVLVATDIAARGIDVEALGHVVNFDVPLVPADYIHRIGRTGRAEAVGDAFTFVARDEEGDVGAIEKVLGKRIPRITLPDFDYHAKPEAKLEIPLAERIAAIRAKKAEDRARSHAKADRRGGGSGGGQARSPSGGGGGGPARSPGGGGGQSRPGGGGAPRGGGGGRGRGPGGGGGFRGGRGGGSGGSSGGGRPSGR